MSTTVEIILGILGMFSANYGSHLLKDYLDRRKERKSHDDNMDFDYHRVSEINPLLEDLKYHLKADKVAEVAFSNGDTTLSGYHLKKVSIITETMSDDPDEAIAPHFQLVPSRKFDRTIRSLYEAENDWVFWDETQEKDETAALNRAFNLNSLLLVAIRNQENKWVGYIMVSWKDKKDTITEPEIQRAQLVASRIGVMQIKVS